jgi:FkbM family methyltransferase
MAERRKRQSKLRRQHEPASDQETGYPTEPEKWGGDPVESSDLTGQKTPFASNKRLETTRTQWQYAEWDRIAELTLTDLEGDQDRAKLAALVAAAHANLGDTKASRTFAGQALKWGCNRKVLARILVSAAHNSLGRAAIAIDDKSAVKPHFLSAIELVEPWSDARLLARTREIRETAQLGLLPAALTAMDAELAELRRHPEDTAPRLETFRTELELIKHELSISLRRGQLYRSEAGPTAKLSSKTEQTLSPDRKALESQSLAQLGQDLWVLERTGFKRAGYFIEFGATDGIALSNTYLLEKEFDWTGLCAEPNPKSFAQLRQNRGCIVSDACIGARTGDEVEFILADAYGGMAAHSDADMHADKRNAYRAAGDVATFTTISLADFLQQHDAPYDIDYLSIDTEGSEYEILATFPFDRWRIKLITVEHNFTPMRQKIHDLLTTHGYACTEAQFDDWYELALEA